MKKRQTVMSKYRLRPGISADQWDAYRKTLPKSFTVHRGYRRRSGTIEYTAVSANQNDIWRTDRPKLIIWKMVERVF